MDRRAFCAGVAFAALIAPVTLRGQQARRMYRIGYLTVGAASPTTKPFLEAMRELGWIEGQNLQIELRYAQKADELPTLAAELVRLKVDLIMTGGTQATQAAKQATKTIPIVFSTGGDPVANGLVASLARPGGNLTGFALGRYDGKLLEVLKEALPGVSRVAYPDVGATSVPPAVLDSAGQVLGLQVRGIAVEGAQDFGHFFAVARKDGADAVLIPNIAWFIPHLERIATEATRNRLPAIGFDRRFVASGGLMSYGPIESQRWPRLAEQIDKILKGAKPGDLPIEQPTKFELLINAKVAKALGLKFPQSLLLRADEVIQ